MCRLLSHTIGPLCDPILPNGARLGISVNGT